MHHFPELLTNRLLLRKLQVADVSSLVKYANNKAVSGNVLNIPHPYTEDDAICWLNFVREGFKTGERFVFAIVLKESDEFIGAVGLHRNGKHNGAEMGYWLGESFWNKGYATEAARAVLKFGFEELNLHKIYATHFTDNIASGKVMLRNGMIKEGEWKEHYKIGDAYKSVIQYRLLKSEYEEAKAANS